MSRRRFHAAPLLAALFGLVALASEAPMASSAQRSLWMATRRTAGSPGLAQMAGAFRVVAANLLWLKVDAYHHEWTERGRDWTQNRDLLPLLRAITYLDPHFVEAYSVHGGLLVDTGKVREGLRILEEGVRNNPQKPELYEVVGLVYGWHLHRPAAARPFFARALALSTDEFDRQRLARTLRLLDARLQQPRTKPAF